MHNKNFRIILKNKFSVANVEAELEAEKEKNDTLLKQ